MSRPTPGSRGIVIGRLLAVPALRTCGAGSRIATLRIATSVPPDEEYVLVAFGQLAERAGRLAEGWTVYAEGRWQARQGGCPELVVDHLVALAPARTSTTLT